MPKKASSGSEDLNRDIDIINFFIILANQNVNDFSGKNLELISNLKKVLENIVESDRLIYSEALNYFLQAQESYKEKYEFSGDGTLVKYRAEVLDGEDIVNLIHGISLQMFKGELSYRLIKFLNNTDLIKMKKCPYCHKFFLAKNKTRKKCYSSDCRKEYERLKKQKQRSDDPVTYS